jgi:hypothetical protein
MNAKQTNAYKPPSPIPFLMLFDSVAAFGWQYLLDDLQEIALVRGDETLAHGSRLLSGAAEDPDDDPDSPPPASAALHPPSRAAPS